MRSGKGNFAQWIEKLQDHYLRKTGMRFYPGTLNLELDSEYALPTTRIRLEAWEYGGAVSVSIVPCRIGELAAFVLRTDGKDRGGGDHARNIVEIACDVRLRDALGLQDGDGVAVRLPVE